MEDFTMDSIMEESEIAALFEDAPEEPGTGEDQPEENENNDSTEVLDVDDFFTDEPEGVGSGKNNEEQEDTKQKTGTSPNTYSSIAKAFVEDGIFPDLDDETVSKIDSAESFRAAVEAQIKANLDERQKRIDEALNAGVEVSDIQKYEKTINYLNSIKDEDLTAEGEKGENLRKQLIYQDFINKGFKKERAVKMVEKSLNAGTDIDDAKEALRSNIEYFKDEYDDLVEEAKESRKNAEKEIKAQTEQLRKSILEDKTFFGDVEVDKGTRQKIIDNISKPVWKDPETGQTYTALQKYQKDNQNDFLKNIGILFTITDGFKTIDKLVNGKVKKEMNKGLRSLENTLNNTARNSDGSLRYATGGAAGDKESFFGKGIKLDI